MTGTTTRPPASLKGAAAGIAAIIVVVLGIYLTQASTTPDAQPRDNNPTPTSSATGTDDPTTPTTSDEAFVAAAIDAAKDGFPAMIPAETPAGWTAGEGTYVADESWHLVMTSEAGAEVTVDQRAGDATALATELFGSLLGGADVNLTRFGTGKWKSFVGEDVYVLTNQLPSTAVVVAGPTKAEVVALAKQLLTAEVANAPNDGSDG